jgi:hypothetical protein
LTSGRFAPELSLTVAGTEVKDDINALICDFSVTDQAQAIEFDLSNLADKYAAFVPFDDIILKLNAVQKFYGRVDSCVPDFSKPGARILKVKGRQIAAAALTDIVPSLQFVDQHPSEIVEGIIDSYNDLKGSSDPAITIGLNLAPDDTNMTVRWQRKSHWKMLQELQEALGGPVAEGGHDEFFDFWIRPATLGTFCFEEAGHEDSGITIPDNVEVTKAKRVIDATPVKNDIWLWCNSQAGRIPLEMQLTYLTGLADTWTEGNAADYDLSGSPIATPSATPTDEYDADYVQVGSSSIYILGPALFLNLVPERITWKLTFPKAGTGVVWPAQDPGGHFNAYNEVSMSESMGEFVACKFWLKAAAEFDILMQCIDSAGVIAYSPSYHYKNNWLPALAADWVNPIFPFGPSANWNVVSATKPPPVFDWSDIVEIAWVTIHGILASGSPEIWFDALEFIKPLVVNAYSTTDAVRKSIHVAKDGIATYSAARLIANALLEEQVKSQVYWDMEEIGRDDIPSGSKFTLGSTELLMREQRWQFVKDSGWVLTGKAWEKT